MMILSTCEAGDGFPTLVPIPILFLIPVKFPTGMTRIPHGNYYNK